MLCLVVSIKMNGMLWQIIIYELFLYALEYVDYSHINFIACEKNKYLATVEP